MGNNYIFFAVLKCIITDHTCLLKSECSVECFKDTGIKLQPILKDLLVSETILITLVCGVQFEGFLKNKKQTNKK